MSSEHPDRPPSDGKLLGRLMTKSPRDARFYAMVVLVVFFNGVLAVIAGTAAYWLWLDPVIPRIEVAESTIKLYPPKSPGDPRIYGVSRRMYIDRDFEGTIHPSFVRPDTSHVEEFEGKRVMRDGTSHNLTPQQGYWAKGWHHRERLWELPASVPSGTFHYVAYIESCNPLRCKKFYFDPLPVEVE